MKNPVRIRRIQVLSLGLLLLAGIVNFLDRSSLGVANTAIRSELGLNATQMGALLSAFSLSYGLMQLPVGAMLDRFGFRPVLAVGLAVWSLAQVLTGYVSGMRSFLSLRVLLGLGEAPFFPAGVVTIREWFEPAGRGRALATLNMSSMLGLALAPPLLTAIMLHTGWRHMFIIIGAIGLLLAAVWYPINKTRASVGITEEERRWLDGDTPPRKLQPITSSDWFGLFRSKTMWGMMLGFGGVNYTNWLYISWLPGYLQAARHVSLEKSGWLAALPFVGGAIGTALSGLVTDAMVRRGHPIMKVLRFQTAGALFCSAMGTLFAAQAETTVQAVAAICVAMAAIHFGGVAGWGFVPAVSEPRMVGSVGAIQNFGSFMIAFSAPLLTGWLLDLTHSFAFALRICAVMTTLGAASYWFIVRAPIALRES